ncbi:MAG TPA: EAL domain-containing protein [Anaeromyxobacteraceae bacterium]|nr:EAL domain-containing protein [Anaeromyxobacteraceae bacterium]
MAATSEPRRSAGCDERLARAYRTLSAGNRMLLRASDEPALLGQMCRVLVEQGGFRLAAVGYAQTDAARSVRWAASAGVDPVLRDLTWSDTPQGRVATGTAIRTGEPVIGRNLRSDPSYLPWPEGIRALLEQGCEAVSAFPLRVDGRVIGALTVAAAEPDAFDAEEVRLLAELADDLAYGIGNLRARARQAEAQALIERLAYRDELTGLPNRVALRDALGDALAAAAKERRSLALLHVDLDRFDEIGDTLGDPASDALIQEVARRVVGLAPPGETVARVGDAELALLLRGGGAEGAARLARGLVAAIDAPVELSGLSVAARASVGIALYPGHGADADVLIRRAKVAAFGARRASAGYLVYEGGIDQEATRRLALMGDLRRAIERDELLLYCQPKVNIATGAACGAEALVRWRHPQHGMLQTGDFIKLAEHGGIITPLTRWVLEAACRQSWAWHEDGLDWPLSVNLSAQDLRDPGLLDAIRGAFTTWGIAPGRIQFELTESALMADPAGAMETLKALKALDVELFIDDFGTGYSSLAYLQKLPVDSLKIDQSFVTGILTSPDSATIVRSTIDLGHDLDLDVVAEGVESKAILDRLAALGCDAAQGYFISTPMPAGQYGAWEAGWRTGALH